MKTISHPPVIETIAIEAKKQSSLAEQYETIDFSNIGYKLNRLIHRESLCFEDYLGSLSLTGNELLYYPALAKKIHHLKAYPLFKEYPLFKRTYPLNTHLKGTDFFAHFSRYMRTCWHQFQSDLTRASNRVNDLIVQYGSKRYLPIIDAIELGDYHHTQVLTIHSIPWRLASNHHPEAIDSINLCDLLELHDQVDKYYHGEFKLIQIEDVTLGTPFIAVRVRKNWHLKGHVRWYNLNTRKPISKADRTKWQHPLESKNDNTIN